MGRLVRFPKGKAQSLTAFLEESRDIGLQKDAVGVMVAFKTKNGNVATMWYGVGFCERQELISHMQLDLVKAMIEINYITPED